MTVRLQYRGVGWLEPYRSVVEIGCAHADVEPPSATGVTYQISVVFYGVRIRIRGWHHRGISST